MKRYSISTHAQIPGKNLIEWKIIFKIMALVSNAKEKCFTHTIPCSKLFSFSGRMLKWGSELETEGNSALIWDHWNKNSALQMIRRNVWLMHTYFRVKAMAWGRSRAWAQAAYRGSRGCLHSCPSGCMGRLGRNREKSAGFSPPQRMDVFLTIPSWWNESHKGTSMHGFLFFSSKMRR